MLVVDMLLHISSTNQLPFHQSVAMLALHKTVIDILLHAYGIWNIMPLGTRKSLHVLAARDQKCYGHDLRFLQLMSTCMHLSNGDGEHIAG